MQGEKARQTKGVISRGCEGIVPFFAKMVLLHAKLLVTIAYDGSSLFSRCAEQGSNSAIRVRHGYPTAGIRSIPCRAKTSDQNRAIRC